MLLISGQTDVQYTALQDLLNQLTKHFCAIPKIMCQFLNKLQGINFTSTYYSGLSPCGHLANTDAPP